MGVRFWLGNGLVLGGMAWMMTFAGMEVRAAEVLPRHGAGPQLDQLETRAALTPASSSSVAALAGAYLDREQPTTPGLRAATIPSDAVTTSASGVVPDISEDNARIQANRVAKRRGLARARVLTLVDEHTSPPLFGLGGEGAVNVLELNRALDRESTR